MNIDDAVAYFDNQPVSDAYTGVFLFNCQPDLFNGTTTDTETGWRRSFSATVVVAPSRGCIEFGSKYYLMGRVIEDFFQGNAVRSSAVVHPSDGLFSLGSAAEVISAAGTRSMHAAYSIRKESKEGSESSQSFNTVSIFVSGTEIVTRDQLLIGPNGVYYRVQNFIPTTGGYKVLVCSELGAASLQSVTYLASGAYDPVADAKGEAAPILTSGVVERYQTNYRYISQANAKYVNGDKVLTVLKSIIIAPNPGESFLIDGATFLIIEAQDDGAECWEIHMRSS